MYRLLTALFASALLFGCSSAPKEMRGTWINQNAIDAAVASGNLREALLAYGPNLEWQIDAPLQRARFSNGYQQNEGRLQLNENGHFKVVFDADHQELLSLSRGKLIQAASDTWPEQQFVPSPIRDMELGSTFVEALYADFMGGTWEIEDGTGRGGLVRFSPDGTVRGLPGAERYALCLAGDCAAMNGDSDGIWLQLGKKGTGWLFEREGKTLRIYQAVNHAPADQIAAYRKGEQRWKLVKR